MGPSGYSTITRLLNHIQIMSHNKQVSFIVHTKFWGREFEGSGSV